MKVSEVREVAEFGDACFQFVMGILHEYGIGVPRTRLSAKEWYERAAKRGFAPAQYALAILLESDEVQRGKKERYGEALRWCEEAAKAGFAPAQLMLGDLLLTAPEKHTDAAAALNWVHRAANQKFAAALAYLAAAYSDGEFVERDEKKAAHYQRAAAENGDGGSAFLLGTDLLEKGDDDSIAEGLKWIRSAASKNNVHAMGHLGRIYAFGLYGIRADTELAKIFQAHAWSQPYDE